MTSKEAFIELRKFLEEKHNEMFLTPVKLETFKGFKLDKIEQDLERLKELEKEYNTLKKEYDTKDLECCSLQSENHNLKMAIEILKDFFVISQTNKDYLINPTGFDKLSKLDYELLKEVLENEINK